MDELIIAQDTLLSVLLSQSLPMSFSGISGTIPTHLHLYSVAPVTFLPGWHTFPSFPTTYNISFCTIGGVTNPSSAPPFPYNVFTLYEVDLPGLEINRWWWAQSWAALCPCTSPEDVQIHGHQQPTWVRWQKKYWNFVVFRAGVRTELGKGHTFNGDGLVSSPLLGQGCGAVVVKLCSTLGRP